MKKKIIIMISTVIIVLVGGYGYVSNSSDSTRQKERVQTNVQEVQKPVISLAIDDGESIATYSGIQATTAFEALSAVSVEQAIELTTKQYDFGIFVEAIGELPNTDDQAWIYHVNGEPGLVAADKMELEVGDSVEWRYTKPNY